MVLSFRVHKKICHYFVHYTRTWRSSRIMVQCLLLKVNVVLLTIRIFLEAEITKKCTNAVHNYDHVFHLQWKL